MEETCSKKYLYEQINQVRDTLKDPPGEEKLDWQWKQAYGAALDSVNSIIRNAPLEDQS